MMVVLMVARSPPAVALPLLLAAALLLACTATGVAAAGPTICDTAKCGKGSCSEIPGLIPLFSAGYNCTCDPGWSKLLPLPSVPCVVPNCSIDKSCYNLSLAWPKGIPITDPCVFINCGPGECVKGEGWSYTCQCHPGYNNFLNLTSLPCIKDCSFGDDCKSKIDPPSPPPPSSSRGAPPPGYVSPWSLMLLALVMVLRLLL